MSFTKSYDIIVIMINLNTLNRTILDKPSTTKSERIIKEIIFKYDYDSLFSTFKNFTEHEEEYLRIFAAIGLGYLTNLQTVKYKDVFEILLEFSKDWSGKVIAYGLVKALVLFFQNNAEFLLENFNNNNYAETNPVYFKAFIVAYAKFISKTNDRAHLDNILKQIDKYITHDVLVIQECLSSVINTLGTKFVNVILDKLLYWVTLENLFTFDIIKNSLGKKLGKIIPQNMKESLLKQIEEKTIKRITLISKDKMKSAELKIKYIERIVHTLLHHINVFFLPFNWGANPYRGCFHACEYCNARSSHEYLGNTREEFERIIYIKMNAHKALIRDLSSPRWKKQKKKLVNLGSVTDPYQPIDKKYEITRKTLEVFLEYDNPCAISTKSDLVIRDIDLLKRMGGNVNVVFSIPSLDETLVSKMEKRAPSISRRLKAVEELKKAGIVVGVLIIPILPYISDNKDKIRELVKVLYKYKVDYVIPDILNLRGDVKIRIDFFLEKYYPHLIPAYKKLYTYGKNNDYADKAYLKDMFDFLMKDCLKKYNLNDYSKMIKGKWK